MQRLKRRDATKCATKHNKNGQTQVDDFYFETDEKALKLEMERSGSAQGLATAVGENFRGQGLWSNMFLFYIGIRTDVLPSPVFLWDFFMQHNLYIWIFIWTYFTVHRQTSQTNTWQCSNFWKLGLQQADIPYLLFTAACHLHVLLQLVMTGSGALEPVLLKEPALCVCRRIAC